MAQTESDPYRRVLSLLGDSTEVEQRDFARDLIKTYGPDSIDDVNVHVQDGLEYDYSGLSIDEIIATDRLSWRLQPQSRMMPCPVLVEVCAMQTDTAGVELQTPTVQPQTPHGPLTSTFIDCVLTTEVTITESMISPNSSVSIMQKQY